MCVAEPGDPCTLDHGAVRLGGVVDDLAVEFVASTGALAGGQQGDECARGRRVLDHAAAGARIRVQELPRQTTQFGHPVEHPHLELGGCRRGRPRHALLCEPRRDEVGERRRPGRVGGEVAVERRCLPVDHRWFQQRTDLAEHLPEVLRLGRRMFGQAVEQPAGLHGGTHWKAVDPSEVVGDHLGRLATPATVCIRGAGGGQGLGNPGGGRGYVVGERHRQRIPQRHRAPDRIW